MDTDFHNQQVIFPTTVICPEEGYDETKVTDIAYKMFYDAESGERAEPFYKMLTGLSFDNLDDAFKLSLEVVEMGGSLDEMDLRKTAFDVRFYF